MSFFQWLRSNAEYYLLAAAQARVARRQGIETSFKSRGPADYFWRFVFVPIYHALPDSFRRFAFYVLPGSHRRAWPPQARRPRPPHRTFPRLDSERS